MCVMMVMVRAKKTLLFRFLIYVLVGVLAIQSLSIVNSKNYPDLLGIDGIGSWSTDGLMVKGGHQLYYHKEKPERSAEEQQVLEMGTQMIENYHHTIVALFFLTHFKFDEAHELVQFQREPEALYIHSMIHRLEGRTIGEGNVSGISNACYWLDQTPPQEMFDRMYKQAGKLAAQDDYLQSFMATMDGKWNPEEFVFLCAQCDDEDAHPSAWDFCLKLVQFEFQNLVDICTTNYNSLEDSQ